MTDTEAKKGLLTIIMGHGKQPEKDTAEENAEGGGEYDEEAMKAAGEELLSAIEGKDPLKVSQAVQAILEVAGSGQEE
jgi:hypothetical protein